VTLKELIKKLQQKPGQDEEVEFLVYSEKTGNIVCMEMTGPTTTETMKLLAKRMKK
jgi:hypothetical protein